MSEYRIHQNINLFEIADEYAKRLGEQVDELALDRAAETLAKYGYVKVVRCRDCKHYIHNDGCMERCARHDSYFVSPDGYCSWAERKECGDD